MDPTEAPPSFDVIIGWWLGGWVEEQAVVRAYCRPTSRPFRR